MKCRICDGEIEPPERAEKYDYCKKPECVRLGMRRLELAAIKNGKAAFDIVQARYAKPIAERGGFMDGRRKV